MIHHQGMFSVFVFAILSLLPQALYLSFSPPFSLTHALSGTFSHLQRLLNLLHVFKQYVFLIP